MYIDTCVYVYSSADRSIHFHETALFQVSGKHAERESSLTRFLSSRRDTNGTPVLVVARVSQAFVGERDFKRERRNGGVHGKEARLQM